MTSGQKQKNLDGGISYYLLVHACYFGIAIFWGGRPYNQSPFQINKCCQEAASQSCPRLDFTMACSNPKEIEHLPSILSWNFKESRECCLTNVRVRHTGTYAILSDSRRSLLNILATEMVVASPATSAREQSRIPQWRRPSCWLRSESSPWCTRHTSTAPQHEWQWSDYVVCQIEDVKRGAWSKVSSQKWLPHIVILFSGNQKIIPCHKIQNNPNLWHVSQSLTPNPRRPRPVTIEVALAKRSRDLSTSLGSSSP
jgi:hypothetical protein